MSVSKAAKKYMVLSAIAVILITSDMENYRYHTKDMDSDSRPPSCYQLKYRGVTYWSCYRMHLHEYFEGLLKVEPSNRRG
jgi:hypothetical protein